MEPVKVDLYFWRAENQRRVQVRYKGRSGGTPAFWWVKKPKIIGPLGYANAAQEGNRLAIVCDVYPEVRF
jgi:hypothetical protein